MRSQQGHTAAVLRASEKLRSSKCSSSGQLQENQVGELVLPPMLLESPHCFFFSLFFSDHFLFCFIFCLSKDVEVLDHSVQKLRRGR